MNLIRVSASRVDAPQTGSVRLTLLMYMRTRVGVVVVVGGVVLAVVEVVVVVRVKLGSILFDPLANVSVGCPANKLGATVATRPSVYKHTPPQCPSLQYRVYSTTAAVAGYPFCGRGYHPG